MNRRKGDLPAKTCPVCGRPFRWRRRWRNDWPAVRYCSERCRRGRGHANRLLAAFFVACCWSWAPSAAAQPVVETGAYLGRWFELARTPNDFQDNRPRHVGRVFSVCTGSTAHYARESADSIRIVNRCERIAGDGTRWRDEARGYALVEPGTDGAVLRIAFGPWWARWLQRAVSLGGFEYRIFALGPKNGRGEYSWSVVGNAGRGFLFLLARSPEVDEATWQAILQAARDAGLPVSRLVRRPKQ